MRCRVTPELFCCIRIKYLSYLSIPETLSAPDALETAPSRFGKWTKKCYRSKSKFQKAEYQILVLVDIHLVTLNLSSANTEDFRVPHTAPIVSSRFDVINVKSILVRNVFDVGLILISTLSDAYKAFILDCSHRIVRAREL